MKIIPCTARESDIYYHQIFEASIRFCNELRAMIREQSLFRNGIETHEIRGALLFSKRDCKTRKKGNFLFPLRNFQKNFQKIFYPCGTNIFVEEYGYGDYFSSFTIRHLESGHFIDLRFLLPMQANFCSTEIFLNNYNSIAISKDTFVFSIKGKNLKYVFIRNFFKENSIRDVLFTICYLWQVPITKRSYLVEIMYSKLKKFMA